MHSIEGLIIVGAGFIACSIATGAFPADPQRRANLERKVPLDDHYSADVIDQISSGRLD